MPCSLDDVRALVADDGARVVDHDGLEPVTIDADEPRGDGHGSRRHESTHVVAHATVVHVRIDVELGHLLVERQEPRDEAERRLTARHDGGAIERELHVCRREVTSLEVRRISIFRRPELKRTFVSQRKGDRPSGLAPPICIVLAADDLETRCLAHHVEAHDAIDVCITAAREPREAARSMRTYRVLRRSTASAKPWARDNDAVAHPRTTRTSDHRRRPLLRASASPARHANARWSRPSSVAKHGFHTPRERTRRSEASFRRRYDGWRSALSRKRRKCHLTRRARARRCTRARCRDGGRALLARALWRAAPAARCLQHGAPHARPPERIRDE
jgi:hypothetical protein